MQAIGLPADIDQNHQIHLQLPETVKAGKAKVIVMYKEGTEQSSKPFTFGLFRGQIQISDDFLMNHYLTVFGWKEKYETIAC